jgi:hypothetical protein
MFPDGPGIEIVGQWSHERRQTRATERVPLRRWELVLFGFGVLVTAGWVLVPVLGTASYAMFATDCGTYDFGCGLGGLAIGMFLGGVSAVAIAFVVLLRWREQPPLRTVAWLVGVVLPVVVVLAAKEVWG